MSDSDMMRHLADDDKPREKAMKQGIGVLSDAELLAILLRVGVQGKSVLTVAREILAAHGNNLAEIARSTPQKLARLVPGIGPAKAITISAAVELGLRCRGAMAQSSRKVQVRGSGVLYDLMRNKVELLPHEEFWLVVMSHSLLVQGTYRVSQGGVTATVVDLKVLFRKVLDEQASAIALVHNHPSGQLRPSMQDDELTRRIVQAAKLLDVRVIDHLIISSDGYYSYNDEGRL